MPNQPEEKKPEGNSYQGYHRRSPFRFMEGKHYKLAVQFTIFLKKRLTAKL
jgi:hypothetical protein